MPFALAEYNAAHDLELDTHASAEAQVAAISDDIAYNNHDLADGLRAGLFTLEDLRLLPLIGRCIAAVDARWPGLAPARREHEALRRFFGLLVEDVLAASRGRTRRPRPRRRRRAVRHLGAPVVRFSDATVAEVKRDPRLPAPAHVPPLDGAADAAQGAGGGATSCSRCSPRRRS